MDVVLGNLPTILALVATVFFAGLLAGLLGVGGGIIIVPVLFFVFQSFDVSMQSAMLIATATSLATIVPTSISSLKSHHNKGNVDFILLKSWSLFILIGVVIGSILVTQYGGQWLSSVFAVIACLSALNMLFRSAKARIADTLPGLIGQRMIASCIGFFSAMVGIGGGTLSVPILTSFNYPAHKAVGSAAGIGLIISLPGAITMLVFGVTPSDAPVGTYGLVNLIGFICIVPLTVIFAPLGAKLANKMNPNVLKKVFATVLLFTGLRMLGQLFNS
ncbi:sulfite exporter TauE/SafE family protein [uncultured Paraglaciecola sp.]|uniref:sulfite exporter TauE/SafE family protein n=1 Tax=uncultured Paraglaciecola sp. TaxID=1765024 RepID=UPI0030D94520|tara:strand:+ start:211163 stop:211987 length:825 start_codon:yes stop_codon:yes gene_type:complete